MTKQVLIWEDHHGSLRVYDATDIDLAYLKMFRDMDAEEYWASSGIDQAPSTEEDALLGKGDDKEVRMLKAWYSRAVRGEAAAARRLCEHASSWESQHSQIVEMAE